MMTATEEGHSKLAEALVKVLGELEDLPKTKTAKISTAKGSFEYSYVDLADVLGYVRPKLADHGLTVIQSATGGPETISVTTMILHTSGEMLTLGPLTMGAGGTAQAMGGAVTYLRRYTLMAALGLATEDDDAQQHTQNPGYRPPANNVDQKAYRSPEEAQIRELIAAQPAALARQIQDSFREEFHAGLSSLPVERHVEALKYVQWLITGDEREPEPENVS